MPGRLKVTLLECREIGQINQFGQKKEGAKVDPYVKLKLGTFKKAPTLKSKVQKKQRAAFSLHEETLQFDIFDPVQYLSRSGEDGNDEIALHVGLWDSNRFSDDMLGEVTISVLDFMEMDDKRYGVLNVNESTDWWPMQFVTKNGVVAAGEIRLRITFLPSMQGVLVITCYEGRNLKNMELIGKMDPYCKFTLGKEKKQTKVVKKGGTNPYFNEEEVRFWISERNWGAPLVVSLFDQDIASSDLIGGRRFSLLPFFTQSEAMQDWFEITNKGKPTGEVQLKFEFFPAGHLKIMAHAGRNLKDTDTLGRQDPYIIFKLSSELVKIERRTKTDTDGGTEPVWEEAVEMPLVDQYELVAEVYDADMIGSDDVIGKAALSLLPVFKNGFADQWVPIGTRNKWGRAESCGEIHLEFDFKGPPGVAYPQLRPDIDTFDDSEGWIEKGKRR